MCAPGPGRASRPFPAWRNMTPLAHRFVKTVSRRQAFTVVHRNYSANKDAMLERLFPLGSIGVVSWGKYSVLSSGQIIWSRRANSAGLLDCFRGICHAFFQRCTGTCGWFTAPGAPVVGRSRPGLKFSLAIFSGTKKIFQCKVFYPFETLSSLRPSPPPIFFSPSANKGESILVYWEENN